MRSLETSPDKTAFFIKRQNHPSMVKRNALKKTVRAVKLYSFWGEPIYPIKNAHAPHKVEH